jgi:hypothetical protein
MHCSETLSDHIIDEWNEMRVTMIISIVGVYCIYS